MRLLIMGAGALGSAVGGFMADAGHQVTLVGRERHMGAIARNGLRITGIWGERLVRTLVPLTSAGDVIPGELDLILITVKSYDTATAVQAVAPLLTENTLVCSYQNGLGNAETIATIAGWERTVGARAIFGVRIVEPGWVEVTVIAQPTALGVYAADAPEARVRAIAEAMDTAGLPTEFSTEISTLLWSKVAYNSALNPLSALLDVPYGRLLDTEDTRIVMRDVVHEVYRAAGATGVRLAPEDPDVYVRVLFEQLIPPTAAHYASMREDFVSRRRTEIDALNGAICRLGMEHGIPCPTNALLTRLVHAREHTFGV